MFSSCSINLLLLDTFLLRLKFKDNDSKKDYSFKGLLFKTS